MFRLKRRTHPVFIEDDDFLSPPRKWLRLRFILVFFMVLLGSWGWHSVNAEAYGDIRAGQLLVSGHSAALPAAFVNIDNKTTIKVSGMVAHVSVVQHFKNNHHDM